MWRKLVPLGAKMSFREIISGVQDYNILNTVNMISPYISQYGVVTRTINGTVVGTELQGSIGGTDELQITVQAGTAILEDSLKNITVDTAETISVSGLADVGASSGYKLVLRHTPILENTVDIVQGFKYTPGGTSLGYTNQRPSYIAWVKPVADTINTNECYIGSGTLNASCHLTSDHFYDTRQSLLLSSNVLNDEQIFKLNQPVYVYGYPTFGSGLLTTETATVHSLVVSGIGAEGIYVYNGDVEAKGATAMFNLIEVYNANTDNKDIYTSEDGNNTYLVSENYIVTPGLRVPTGETNMVVYDEDGVSLGNMLLSGDTPTTPCNLHLWDINPDEYGGNRSAVSFKWNYDDVLLSGLTKGDTVIMTSPEGGFARENKTLAGSGANDTRWQIVVSGVLNGKYLYFPATQNSYEILGHSNATSDYSGNFVMVIESGLTSADAAMSQLDADLQTPCRIIDKADEYILTINRHTTDPTSIDPSALAGTHYFKEVYFLPHEYVTNPTFVAQLPTTAKYTAKIQARKNFATSTEKRLNADYNTANRYYYKTQDFIGYGETGTDQVEILPAGTGTSRYYFTNSLPDIDTGGITLTPTDFGCVLSITGWIDTNDPDKCAHEFEILYKEGDAPSDWEDVTGTSIDASYTRIVTQSRRLSITSSVHSQFAFAAWPLQNGDRVASASTSTVTMGGGGVYPTSSVLATQEFDLKSYSVPCVYDNLIRVADGTYPVYTPAISGVDTRGSLTPADILGGTITRGDTPGSDFYITDAYWYDADHEYIEMSVIATANDNGAETAASGICYINNTSLGRRMFAHLNMGLDYQLTSASLEITGGNLGNSGAESPHPGIVRIYQLGRSSSADYIEVSSIPTIGSYTLDGTVRGVVDSDSFGTTLVIDAVDPDGVNNHCNLKGRIVVRGKPLLIDSTTKDGTVIPTQS